MASVHQNEVQHQIISNIVGSSTEKSSVDASDIKHHAKIAEKWWDPNGSLYLLHAMNNIRVPFITDGLFATGKISKQDKLSAKPLQNMLILDVGCGGGILCEPLARCGASVTGLDAGEDVIAAARDHMEKDPSLAGNLTYVQSSIENHASKNKNKYDAVVISEVIEHVTEKDIFLAACIDVLQPGGSIFITTFNKNFLSWLWGIIIAERVGFVPKGTHQWEKFISPEDTEKILNKLNCSTVCVKGMRLASSLHNWTWTPFKMINYALQAVKRLD